jgi:hypothetical protein
MSLLVKLTVIPNEFGKVESSKRQISFSGNLVDGLEELSSGTFVHIRKENNIETILDKRFNFAISAAPLIKLKVEEPIDEVVSRINKSRKFSILQEAGKLLSASMY